ncbi:MAG: hypothetical protein J6B07_00935 [Opitutales bacterium]|nr:hypothetical protein [Opitutales bacterium]
MNKFIFHKIIFTTILCFFYTYIFATNTLHLSLNGEWDFKIIDDFEKTIKAGKIKVPGIWEEQGYGSPTKTLNHSFLGLGIYETEVDIPANWKELDTNIVLEGVSKYAKVWVNEKFVGNALGHIGSHRINVSKYLKFGDKNKIKIEVDSRPRLEFDTMRGCHYPIVIDYLWSGLYRSVYIEGLPKVRLTDYYVRSFIEPTTRIVAETKIYYQPDYTQPKECPYPQALRLIIKDVEGNIVANKTKAIVNKDGKYPEQIIVEVENAKLWSPDSPYLYNVELSLLDKQEKVIHTKNSRMGIREFKLRRHQIFLNNKPIFLSGYGDNLLDTKGIILTYNKQQYIDRLKKFKALGFNHVRHHSTIMPSAYFDACDEVGMLVNAEFAIGYSDKLPGTSLWHRDVPSQTSVKESFEFMKSRLAQAIKDVRNHVSIFAWSGGNEYFMGNDFSRSNEFLSDIKGIVNTLDPNRFFIDTDGEHAPFMLNTENDRKTLDFYVVLFDDWLDYPKFSEKYKTKHYAKVQKDKIGTPYELSKKNYSEAFYHIMLSQNVDGMYASVTSPLKPTLAHEMANFTTFTRLDVFDAFKSSNVKPFWINDNAEKIKKLGMEKICDEWASASEKLFTRTYKHNIEALRKNIDISGYHLWCIQDFWTTSSGIFDFAEKVKKDVDANEFAKLNSQIILLQDGLKDYYDSKSKISMDILISNFNGEHLNADVKATIRTKENILAKIHLGKKQIGWNGWSSISNLGKITNIEKFINVKAPKPTEYIIEVECITENDKKYSNSWSFYFIPNVTSPENIYTDTDTSKAIPEWWNAKPVSDISAIDKNSVLFLSRYSIMAKQALEKGATVVLIQPKDFLSNYVMQYKSAWWKAGRSHANNYVGHFVDEKSPFIVIAPERYCSEAFASLLSESRRYDITHLEQKTFNHIKVIPSLTMLRDYVCLASAKAFNGTLILSGLSPKKIRNTQLNAWALKTMLSADNNNFKWDSKLINK